MIARRGRILAVQDGMATIRVDTPAACASCGSRSACGSTGTTVRLPVAAALRAGDDVTLTLAEGTLVRGALRAYLLPTTTLLLGAIALSAFGDLAAVGGALSGLGVGLIAQRILARRATCASPAVSPAPTFEPSPIGEPT
ncbi:MAG: SoxR reducing system RseC family protein [Rhodocyclaceae bacterium]|nr:SoxR reducing system RseC family protein [Rhodocyclaceae bacterium]